MRWSRGVRFQFYVSARFELSVERESQVPAMVTYLPVRYVRSSRHTHIACLDTVSAARQFLALLEFLRLWLDDRIC